MADIIQWKEKVKSIWECNCGCQQWFYTRMVMLNVVGAMR